MSEQENISTSEPKDEDVEAHKKKALTDEPKAEGESDDDVEAHKKKSLLATDEPKAEGESDDDVELHKRRPA